MKRLKLKRKYLVIVTIVVTILSMQMINIVDKKIDWINKKAEQCDLATGYTCSAYELRHYLLNK